MAGSGGGCGGLRGVTGEGRVDLGALLPLFRTMLLLLISKDEGAKRIGGSWDTLGLDLPSASTKFWRTGPFSGTIYGGQPLSLVLNFVLGCLSNLYPGTTFVLR